MKTRSITPPNKTGHRDPRRGAVVLVVAVSAFAMLGVGALAIDLGRLFIVKNELQNYTDAAALAGVTRLDGTSAGFANARSEAENSPNSWNFDTAAVGTITVEFSTAIDGSYVEAPATATGYRFIRVTAETAAPVYLAQIIPGVGSAQMVRARSIAGLVQQTSIADGIFPFSPDAHDVNDPDYGFLLGKYYTLKYDKATGNLNGIDPSPSSYLLSQNDKKLIGCPADMEKAPNFRPGMTVGSGNAAERGHIDLADREPDNGGGANLISDTILGKVSYGLAVSIGYTIVMEPGNKASINNTILERVQQDTDGGPGTQQTASYFTTGQISGDYPTEEDMNSRYRSTYATDFPRPPNGNGRRIVTVPVNDPLSNVVVGFAAFFLPLNPCADSPAYNGKTYNPCCGEYIGSLTLNSGGAPGPGAGTFRPMLLQ